MPHLTIPLAPNGPIVHLFVGVSAARDQALRKAGQPVPVMQRIITLIDTGASGTVIDTDAIQPLGLTPTGIVLVHTPSTAGQAATCPQYDVSLAIYHPDHSVFLGTMPVMCSHLSSSGIQALVGRDVLQKCPFVYDGSAGHFSLAF